MNYPNEVIDGLVAAGIKKYKTPLPKLILLGMLAGIYIAFGGLLSSLAAAGFGGVSSANPFFPKFIAGATFPVGLMLVILVGAELFTGNTAYLMPATLRGSVPRTYFLKNWAIVFLANFVGAFIFEYLFIYKAGIMAKPEYSAYIQHAAEYKTHLEWHVVLLRGVGANWMVCLAVWMGLSSKSMAGRLLGIWWPVMAFVAIGYEHSIANMFYIPTGILYGADVTWADFVFKNLIPATIGNIIGGGVFVGCAYYYLYGQKAKETK